MRNSIVRKCGKMSALLNAMGAKTVIIFLCDSASKIEYFNNHNIANNLDGALLVVNAVVS